MAELLLVLLLGNYESQLGLQYEGHEVTGSSLSYEYLIAFN